MKGTIYGNRLPRGTQMKKSLGTTALEITRRPSVWNTSAPTGRIFMQFDIWVSFENLSWKLKINYNPTRITGALHGEEFAFLIISRSFLLGMRNVSDKSCRENQNTHFVFNSFIPKIGVVYEIMWKYTVRAGQATDGNIILHRKDGALCVV